MINNLLSPPSWLVTLSPVLAALVTVVFTALMNRRNARFTRDFQRHSAQMAEKAAETADALASLKNIEMSNATAVQYAQIVETRARRLHDDLAELLAITDLMSACPSLATDEDRRRCLRLVSSLGLAISTRGDFGEEFNIELGHLREAAIQGSTYLDTRRDTLGSLQLKAWRIIDAEYDRALDSVSTGATKERPVLKTVWMGKPYHLRPEYQPADG